MPTAVVAADALREEPLARLAETAPVSAAEAAGLAEAMLDDALAAVARSAFDPLVHHPPAEESRVDDPAAVARERAAAAGVEEPRAEVQVGSSRAARVGNAVTHLLEEEGVTSVVALDARAPLLARGIVDEAGMQLRSHEAVFGPAPGGRVYLAGFREPVDFADAYGAPALRTLTERAVAADLDVNFLRQLTAVETGTDLAGVVADLEARRAADRPVPAAVAAWVEETGLTVRSADHDLEVVR